MNILKYSQWKDTALTLHLVMQMLGKTKLARMYPQPEWNHTVLQITSDGFCTGLIPYGDKSFSISVHVRESRVITTGIDGRKSGFAFRPDTSTSEYYQDFNRMLADVMCTTEIYTVPQEMALKIPFEQDTEKRHYDSNMASDFFHMCVFAHNALLRFVSPFRGKKVLPSFFWGTFDVSAMLFSGRPEPFQGKGVIEQSAFDEEMIEFGFWPGDENQDEPHFFVLPYPFITDDLSGEEIQPREAFFSQEKSEFFLSLREVMTSPNPEGMVQEFFHSTYALVTAKEGWKNLDWFNKPLLSQLNLRKRV